MIGKRISPALTALVVLAAAAQARCQAPPESVGQTQTAPAATPPAPAFKAGDTVLDRDGQAVGAIQTLVEAPSGLMVVVRIDGKLVSLPQSTLRLEGARVVSGQTKAQMLAAAGAPP